MVKWWEARLTTLMALTHINFAKGLPMKHSIEELQFAATVRELVRKRQNFLAKDMTPEEAQEFSSKPADDLIADVMRELGGIANVIKKSQQA